MDAAESEIHPFCSVEDWYSFGMETTGEWIKVLHLKKSAWKTICIFSIINELVILLKSVFEIKRCLAQEQK